MGLCAQTAINSNLKKYLFSPYLTSAVSFTIGSIFLWLIVFIFNSNINKSLMLLINSPKYLWIGGVLGAITITLNIYLFSKLGSVQTSIFPIIGQILTGILIDQYGLFHSKKVFLTKSRFLGVLIIITGVIFFLLSQNEHKSIERDNKFLIYQLVALINGVLIAIQSSVNGLLGVNLSSPILAGAISFSTGAFILILFVLFTKKSLSKIKYAWFETGNKKWLWSGGIFGATYISGIAWLVPKLGTEKVLTFAILGQLILSSIIENYGLFSSKKIKLSILRLLGLLTMIIGILIITFF